MTATPPPIPSAEYIIELGKYDVTVRGMLSRMAARTYAQFLDQLYNDVVVAVEELERNPGDDEPEDETSKKLLLVLRGMGYSVHHDASSGGHVDITVENQREGFRWLAEAKKFTDVGDLREGYLQLATRYKPQARDDRLHGGLIGYLRRSNAAQHVQSWRTYLPTMPAASDAVLSDCVRRRSLGFSSEHSHQDFGLPFDVWHVFPVLTVAPKDASARNAKKYR